MDYEELQNKVSSFASEVNPSMAEYMLRIGGEVIRDVFFGGPPFKQWWAQAKEIQAGFNSKPRFPTAQLRQECWETFQEARTALAQASRIDRENKEATSQMHKGIILEKVADARIYGNPGTSRTDVQILKDKGAVLGAAMKLLHDRKDRMLGEHKGECHAAIQAMKDDHDERWRIIRGASEQYQREKRERAEGNLARNRERYAKTSEALDRQRAHKAKLEDQLSGDCSTSYRTRIQGWMDECITKISDMEQSLEKIQQWIDQDEERLSRNR